MRLPFLCTLGGPFDELFLTRLPATRALCEGIFAVISASTVWAIRLLTHYSTKKMLCQGEFQDLFQILRGFLPQEPAFFEKNQKNFIFALRKDDESCLYR